MPFFGDDRFTALSPLRRVPVLIDDRVTLADSTVICQYLEDRYPAPALYPADVADRARARWLEEYADSRMGDVFIWGLFNHAVIAPAVWGTPRDLRRDPAHRQRGDPAGARLPRVAACRPRASCSARPASPTSSIAAFLRNAAFARYTVDPTRWPRTAQFVDRVLALDCLARLQPFEALMLRTPIPEQRAALAAAGAPV